MPRPLTTILVVGLTLAFSSSAKATGQHNATDYAGQNLSLPMVESGIRLRVLLAGADSTHATLVGDLKSLIGEESTKWKDDALAKVLVLFDEQLGQPGLLGSAIARDLRADYPQTHDSEVIFLSYSRGGYDIDKDPDPPFAMAVSPNEKTKTTPTSVGRIAEHMVGISATVGSIIYVDDKATELFFFLRYFDNHVIQDQLNNERYLIGRLEQATDKFDVMRARRLLERRSSLPVTGTRTRATSTVRHPASCPNTPNTRALQRRHSDDS